jgi:hypothetical protein
MSESPYHTKMVREISCWISNQYSDKDVSILLDMPGTPPQQLPRIINKYRPDVFAHDPIEGNIYIGEAKTARDLETPHSIRQIKTFLKYLSGKNKPVLIIATTWDMGRCAKSLVTALKKQVSAENVNIEYITVWP